MECYIPLERSISSFDVSSMQKSHELRKFMIFDEQLKLVLHTADQKKTSLRKFTVFINDAKVHQSSGTDAFEKVNDDGNILELKSSICSQSIFRSSVVMNNGYNNKIKFCIEYIIRECESEANLSVAKNEENVVDEDEYLPSFEALTSPATNISKTIEINEVTERVKNVKSIAFTYPIYSLLNMRLRNALQKSPGFILSSLDFQTSKASIHFAERFLNLHSDVQNFYLNFLELSYALVDRGSHIKLDPICPFEIPFVANAHDGFNVIYKLPLIPGSSNNTAANRARITLRYILVSTNPQMNFSVPVLTTWETDVTLKRPMSNSAISQASSSLSTPRLYGVSPRVNFMGSVSSLVNSKLSNVKFKFINSRVTAARGEKFTMRLQIINSSPSPLDMVIYYNNKLSPPNPQSASLSMETQYQLYKRYRKITEGIILLSNDYKVPLVDPNETYHVDLCFVGIMSGYYSTLPGLKMVDLQTSELIEIGMGASILIK